MRVVRDILGIALGWLTFSLKILMISTCHYELTLLRFSIKIYVPSSRGTILIADKCSAWKLAFLMALFSLWRVHLKKVWHVWWPTFGPNCLALINHHFPTRKGNFSFKRNVCTRRSIKHLFSAFCSFLPFPLESCWGQGQNFKRISKEVGRWH